MRHYEEVQVNKAIRDEAQDSVQLLALSVLSLVFNVAYLLHRHSYEGYCASQLVPRNS